MNDMQPRQTQEQQERPSEALHGTRRTRDVDTKDVPRRDLDASQLDLMHVDLLVGGFGQLNQEHSKGIEHFRLSLGGPEHARVALRRVGLLAALPSPTWLVAGDDADDDLIGDADGDAGGVAGGSASGAARGDGDGGMVVAVLENTSEIATLRIRREAAVAAVGADVDNRDRDDDRTGTGVLDDEAVIDTGAGHVPQIPSALRLVEEGRVPVRGAGPTHAIIARDDHGARHLLAANYGDGSISVHPMDDRGVVLEAAQLLTGSGGGPLPAQEGPHAHWLLQVPDGRVLSTDLGADRIHVHDWRDGVLRRIASIRLMPGTGPRDMHMLPTGDLGGSGWRVAVVDEWGGTVTVLASEPDIHVVQTVELGGDDNDQAASMAYVPMAALGAADCADCADDPAAPAPYSGFAYVGLRGSERIVTLRWDGESLERLDHPWIDGWRGRGVSCGGSRPRQLIAIDDILLAADEASDNLAVFRLSADGQPRLISTVAAPSPTVMLPLPVVLPL